MRKYVLILLLLATGISFAERFNTEEYAIIPYPANIEYKKGSISLRLHPIINYSAQLETEAELLKEYLADGFETAAVLKAKSKSGDIQLRLDKSLLPAQKEGYVLDISNEKVLIKANTAAGILNGIQTLRQILHKKAGRLTAQKGTITDHPEFSWRACMLDEGRYFQGTDVVKRFLDEMSALKLNIFHWHLTDDQGWRIEIKKYPKLTEVGGWRDSSEINHFGSNVYDGKRHGGFYTQEQIREIVAYAAKLHIRVIPEIEMPGHASAAIAAYPWLGTENKPISVPGKFGVHHNVYNVADPRVTNFFNDVINEVIKLFPDTVFHIGGDEVKYDQWKNSPIVQAYMKNHGLSTPAELQVFFTNRMSNLLLSKKRHMMGWNEITGDKLHEYQSDKDTNVKQALAKGTIVQCWKGDTALIRKTIKRGYDVVNSYHSYTYMDYTYKQIPLIKAYNFSPVPEGLSAEEQKHVLGIGCQMWGEFTPDESSINLKMYPRVAAYAEAGWTNPSKKNFDRFRKSLNFFLSKWKAKGIIYGKFE